MAKIIELFADGYYTTTTEISASKCPHCEMNAYYVTNDNESDDGLYFAWLCPICGWSICTWRPKCPMDALRLECPNMDGVYREHTEPDRMEILTSDDVRLYLLPMHDHFDYERIHGINLKHIGDMDMQYGKINIIRGYESKLLEHINNIGYDIYTDESGQKWIMSKYHITDPYSKEYFQRRYYGNPLYPIADKFLKDNGIHSLEKRLQYSDQLIYPTISKNGYAWPLCDDELVEKWKILEEQVKPFFSKPIIEPDIHTLEMCDKEKLNTDAFYERLKRSGINLPDSPTDRAMITKELLSPQQNLSSEERFKNQLYLKKKINIHVNEPHVPSEQKRTW